MNGGMSKMGGRYYLKGTQLGMIMSLVDKIKLKKKLKDADKHIEFYKLMNEIMDKQYICEAEQFDKLLMCLELEK